jgi:hypothetical protein
VEDVTQASRGQGRTSAAAAVALAVVVLAGWLALAGGWVALLVVDRGVSRIVWAVLGALLLWQLVPRPPRPREQAELVDEQTAPGLHALAGAVADAAGCPPPRRILLDTTYRVGALPVGYARRADLVVGLPQWTVLRPQERVAAVGLALAGADVLGRPAGAVVRLADDVLAAARELLKPPGTVGGDRVAAGYSVSNPVAVDVFEVNRVGRSVSKNVGAAGMMAVAAPVRLVQRALGRAWAPCLAAAVLDADARVAGVAGREAAVGVLLTTAGVPAGLTAAASAARYGRDPFQALAESARPSRAEYTGRLVADAERGSGPGPTTLQRVEALERGVPATGAAVDPGLAARADAEVVRLRAGLAARLTDELRAGSAT